jgi:uncharacterized YigZ family protein
VSESFRTLDTAFEYELDPIKGSRFLAVLAPTAHEEAAMEFVQTARKRWPDARHHCFAWRLGPDGALFRSSDDGEPSGSAGQPILNQLKGHGITDLTCVVLRWFGGTKLGVGGLMRAYGGAAGRALDRAPIREVVITVPIRLLFPWECSGAVSGVLHALSLKEQAADYGEQVSLDIDVPREMLKALETDLAERTGGRVLLQGR